MSISSTSIVAYCTAVSKKVEEIAQPRDGIILAGDLLVALDEVKQTFQDSPDPIVRRFVEIQYSDSPLEIKELANLYTKAAEDINHITPEDKAQLALLGKTLTHLSDDVDTATKVAIAIAKNRFEGKTDALDSLKACFSEFVNSIKTIAQCVQDPEFKIFERCIHNFEQTITKELSDVQKNYSEVDRNLYISSFASKPDSLVEEIEKDPQLMAHCEEIRREAEVFNENVKMAIGSNALEDAQRIPAELSPDEIEDVEPEPKGESSPDEAEPEKDITAESETQATAPSAPEEGIQESFLLLPELSEDETSRFDFKTAYNDFWAVKNTPKDRSAFVQEIAMLKAEDIVLKFLKMLITHYKLQPNEDKEASMTSVCETIRMEIGDEKIHDPEMFKDLSEIPLFMKKALGLL